MSKVWPIQDSNVREWLLKIAAEVEKDPSRWTKGTYARNAAGTEVSAHCREAVCWCSYGFVVRGDLLWSLQNCAIDALCAVIGGKTMPIYSDSLATTAGFCAWFRAASELCA